MKVALVALVLCLALSGTDAWRGGFGFRGGFGLGFGRWGGWGGWGWGAPWRWGLGPWGWGAGFGVPAIPAAVPAVAPAVAAVGKRDVESVVNTGLVVPPQINNETVCTFAEKKSILSCLGNTFNFECDVIPTHLIDITPAGIRNLTVVVDERIVDGVQVPVFRLFSRVGHVLNDYSLINSEKEVVLTVYHDEKLNTETGIRIADEQCWSAFIRMIKEVVPYIVRFDLVEQQVARA